MRRGVWIAVLLLLLPCLSRAADWDDLGPRYRDEDEVEDARLAGDLSDDEADRLEERVGFDGSAPLKNDEDRVSGELRQEVRLRSASGPGGSSDSRTRARLSALDGRLRLGGLWNTDRFDETGRVTSTGDWTALRSREIRWRKRSARWENCSGGPVSLQAAWGNFRLPAFDDPEAGTADGFEADLLQTQTAFRPRRPWPLNGEGFRLGTGRWSLLGFHSRDRYAAPAEVWRGAELSTRTVDGAVEGEAEGARLAYGTERFSAGLFWVHSRSDSEVPVDGVSPAADSPGLLAEAAWDDVRVSFLGSETLDVPGSARFFSASAEGGAGRTGWTLAYRERGLEYENPAGRRFDGLFASEALARMTRGFDGGSAGWEYRRRERVVGPFVLPSQRMEGRARIEGSDRWTFFCGASYEDLKSVSLTQSGIGSRSDEWLGRVRAVRRSFSGVRAEIGAELRRTQRRPSGLEKDGGVFSAGLGWRAADRLLVSGEVRRADSDFVRPDTETDTVKLGLLFRPRPRCSFRLEASRRTRSRRLAVIADGIEADEEVPATENTLVLRAQLGW